MLNKPSVYIYTNLIKEKGFKYDQPVEFCNGIRLTFDVIKNFKKVFKKPFKIAYSESNAYNKSIEASMYFSKVWNNESAKNKAFDIIYNFILNGKSGNGSSITPLFPFEIYMMNDGFEMLSFCELNAINPAISIVAEKQIGNTLINPIGFKYGRCYQRDDLFIYLAFGIEIRNKKTNFYFKTNKSHYTFQVDNDYSNYQKAINGNLNPLELN